MSQNQNIFKMYFMPRVQATSESCSVMSDSLWPHGLYSPWNSPGQNTGVGSLSFLQGSELDENPESVPLLQNRKRGSST